MIGFRAVGLALQLLGLTGASSSMFSYENTEVPPDPDVGKNMIEIVETRGYEIESHFATTPDGYILNMFRIPFGKNANTKTASGELRSPVILQHGLLDSSFTWVNNYDNESLAFILADAGFDVWMGNNRGNRYGRNHTTLNPDDGTLPFWAFSWDEMAALDVPTMINYVTEQTGSSSVGWVGHSEGTIQMFAASSDAYKSEYLSDAIAKVNLFVALAPVAYVYNLKSEPIQFLAKKLIIDEIFYDRHIYEIGKHDDQLNALAPKICEAYERSCELFLDLICGPSRNLNETRVQVYVSGTPAGTSTQNMLHWEQGVLQNSFQKFDYGSAEANAERYGGETTPPLYDLSKVPTSFNIAMFSGDLDWLADPKDVEHLLEELPAENIVYNHVTPLFAHLDYTWAWDANVKIYDKVTELLGKYSKKE
jgi:pimeloyl-ACP methyl ester carboxylesterase